MRTPDHVNGSPQPHIHGPRTHSDASNKDLIDALFEQGKRLIREEVKLARSEIREEAAQAGKSAGMIGGGAWLLHAGGLAFGAFLMGLLALWLPFWASALVVSVLFLGVGALVANAGRTSLKKVSLKPEQTMQTLKEDKAWMNETMHAVKSRRRAEA